MTQAMQVILLVAAILAFNGLLWAAIIALLRRKGRAQVEKYGSVPLDLAAGEAEHEGRAHHVATLIDDGRYHAPGYFARGLGTATLTEGALSLRRAGARRPVLIPRADITKVERRSRFARRGRFGHSITVIHWEMGGGRFRTGIVFAGDEDERLAWERRLRP